MLETEQLFGPLVATFFIGITTVLLVYWFSTRNFDYWKKRGVIYAKPVPFFGSLWDNIWKPLHDVEYERYFKLGKVYGHFEANRALISVADSKLLREIFVKDFQYFINRRHVIVGDKIVDSMVSSLQGEDWKRVRSIITPTFTSGKIKRMMAIFKDSSKTLVDNFTPASEKGTPIDAKKIYGAFTMDVIASSAFSTKIDSHNDPENKFVRIAKNGFGLEFGRRIALHQLVPQLMKLFGIPIIDPTTTGFFKDVTLQIIEERKRTGQTRNDFLQLLMDTAKEVAEEQKWDIADKGDVTSNYGDEESTQQVFKNMSSKNLSLDEMVGQCVIFFLAGYDTSGSTLSFITYNLALNEEVQEKCYEELQEVLQATKGELTYEAVQNMKYLDNVISETLRLYSPVTRLERVAENDYKLGGTGITVPKGMILTIPTYAIHRDPKIYPDPEKFDPDRFTPEERANRDTYAYLPFGAGPRNCIGMRFALVEIKVCLAYVINNFKIKRSSRTKVPLDFHVSQGLLQPLEIIVELEKRNGNPMK